MSLNHPPPEPPTNGSETSGLTLIDHVQQRLLDEELGVEMMADLKARFWVEAALFLQSANSAIKRQDFSAADAVLHTLKGAAQTLGYMALGDAAEAARPLTHGPKSLESLETIAALTRSADATPQMDTSSER